MKTCELKYGNTNAGTAKNPHDGYLYKFTLDGERNKLIAISSEYESLMKDWK